MNKIEIESATLGTITKPEKIKIKFTKTEFQLFHQLLVEILNSTIYTYPFDQPRDLLNQIILTSFYLRITKLMIPLKDKYNLSLTTPEAIVLFIMMNSCYFDFSRDQLKRVLLGRIIGQIHKEVIL